jgi:hypothetical protein
MSKWIAVVVAAGILLVGCNSNEKAEKSSKTEEQNPVETVQEEQEEKSETGVSMLTEEAGEQEAEGLSLKAGEDSNETNQPEANTRRVEAAILPEYNVILKRIGKDDYTVETITDNEGTRVLHFLNEQGEMHYKSVFVKDTNRLKIIDTKGGGEVFNEVIT